MSLNSVRLGLVALVTSAAALLPAKAETLLLRDPAISEDKIAFVYAGDVWIANRDGRGAKRLTSLEADEGGPIFSPDGQNIAYTANYQGNVDVYSISINGGQSTRHTWHPGADTAIDWSPDGSVIAFTSARERLAGRSAQLFHSHPEGGLPEKQMEARIFRGQYNESGDKIASIAFGPAYNALYGGSSGWRGYRGGTTPTIQILDQVNNRWVEIPGERVNDLEPMWSGGSIYFISDRGADKVFNIYQYDSDSKAISQITQENIWDIRAASIFDGTIIYEAGGQLKLLNTATGAVSVLSIDLNPDLPQLQSAWKNVAGQITAVDLSNSGKRVAVTARGEVFSVPVKDGTIRNLTASDGVRDYSALWSPDGKSIAYIEDQDRQQVLKIEDQSGVSSVRNYDLGSDFNTLLDWGGKGDHILYQNNHLQVFILDLTTGRSRQIGSDARRQFGRGTVDTDMSPDGRWVALTFEQPNFNRDLFLYNVDNTGLTKITDGLADAGSPAFSPDGKLLYFTASTNAGPTQVGLDMTTQERPYRAAIYVTVLESDGKSPLLPKTGDETGEEKKSEGNKEKKSPITVELNGLEKRIAALPVAEANYTDLSVAKDGTLYFVQVVQPGVNTPAPGENQQASAQLMRFDMEKRKAETVMAGVVALQISDDGSKILVSKPNGSLHVGDIGKKIEVKPLNLSSMRMLVDPKKEWAQIFDDVWRMEASYFYDPDMHGLDWDGIYNRYKPLLAHVGRREDLNGLMTEMIGEMQVGHNRLGGGDVVRDDSPPTGLLGTDFVLDRGRHKIARIYSGETWNPFLDAPLAMPGLNINEGDYVFAVNGEEVGPNDNIFQKLAGTVGVQTVLTISDDISGRRTRDVTIVPTRNENAIRLWAWVEGNRKAVEEASDGRVGYVYLPNTAGAGFTFFNRLFFAQTDKEAMIIDERANGGGQAANYITDVLSRTYLAGWKDRDGLNFNTPGGAMFGPKVMLIDQDAGSGGDFLPYSFRHMGIGKLIGRRTWGGLIGIAVNPGLVDGGFLTVPYFRFFDTDGDWTIENEGVAPDIKVPLDPIAANAGRDTQLERAISEILDEMQRNPSPIPSPEEGPAFPTELGQ